MPRSERRRWWLERDIGGWSLVLDDDPPWRAGSVDDEMPQGRGVVALWRLVQWLKLRLSRERWEKFWLVDDAQSTAETLIADADAAVLEARVSEERTREENERLRAELARLAWVVCDQDSESINRVLGNDDPEEQFGGNHD